MQKYNKNSAGEQSVRSFFFLPLMAGSSWRLFPLIAEAAMSFISIYFAMLEFVITFVKNKSRTTAVFNIEVDSFFLEKTN